MKRSYWQPAQLQSQPYLFNILWDWYQLFIFVHAEPKQELIYAEVKEIIYKLNLKGREELSLEAIIFVYFKFCKMSKQKKEKSVYWDTRMVKQTTCCLKHFLFVYIIYIYISDIQTFYYICIDKHKLESLKLKLMKIKHLK